MVTDYFHFAEGDINYLNASEDETIEFGTPKVDIENYPSNYAEQWILIVPEGRKVQIDFDISLNWKTVRIAKTIMLSSVKHPS